MGKIIPRCGKQLGRFFYAVGNNWEDYSKLWYTMGKINNNNNNNNKFFIATR